MRDLYPEIEPYRVFNLDVGTGHTLYVEECGVPDGLPVVCLHGRPSASGAPWQRRFFNPEKYRIVLFDQRGCGRSMPHAELENNTTPDLISDMEKLRSELNIDKWLIFGGCWGSSLALAYAEAYPKHCLGLILHSIFLCRRKDIHWFCQSGADSLFPDVWRDFEVVIPSDERKDMVAAYYRRLTHKDESVRVRAAKAWAAWKGRTLSLVHSHQLESFFSHLPTALSLARIECHYFINRMFMHENQLLDQSHRLRDIPGVIVHGRYNVVCPVNQAFTLHHHWPSARLEVVADAGHAMNEPGIMHRLLEACDEMASQLQS